jgi:hypothetical protein
MRVKKLAAPVEVEPPRSGEDAADCVACNTPDDAYIWVSERWRVRSMDRPTGLPMVLILECRSHLDIGDLPNLLAAELGVMTVRLERAIRSLDGVARVHVNRWGDGSAHLHMWFLARPYGRLQLRGTFLSLWDDILPVIPEEQWLENLALVAAWLADFGGRALAEPPHIHWQSPSTFSDQPRATAASAADDDVPQETAPAHADADAPEGGTSIASHGGVTVDAGTNDLSPGAPPATAARPSAGAPVQTAAVPGQAAEAGKPAPVTRASGPTSPSDIGSDASGDATAASGSAPMVAAARGGAATVVATNGGERRAPGAGTGPHDDDGGADTAATAGAVPAADGDADADAGADDVAPTELSPKA